MDLRSRAAVFLLAAAAVACGTGGTSLAPPSLAPGELDPTFGDGGVVRIPFTSSVRPYRRGLRIATDGSSEIVLRGAQELRREIITVALEPDGALATDGILRPLSGTDELDAAFTSAGRILVSTASPNPRGPAFVARLGGVREGLDPTFGVGGFVEPGFERIGGMHPLADGRALILGREADAATLIVRLNEDGSLDPSFGADGVARPRVEADVPVTLSLGATDREGRILLVAVYAMIGQPAAILALTADGTRDKGFGTDGLSEGFGNFSVVDVEVMPTGEIVVLTGSGTLRRLAADGRTITTIPDPGRPVANLGDVGSAPGNYLLLAGRSLVVGEDDPLCPAGSGGMCLYAVPAVQAIDAAGEPAPGFGPDGVSIERGDRDGFQGTGSWSVVAAPPGKITVAGAACKSTGACDLVVFRAGAPEATPCGAWNGLEKSSRFVSTASRGVAGGIVEVGS